MRPRYQGVSYWVVPGGTTQDNAGVEAELDDGRGLGGAFGTTQVICCEAVLQVLVRASSGAIRYYSLFG